MLNIDIDNDYKYHEIKSFCNAKAEEKSVGNIRLLDIFENVVHTMFSEDASKILSSLHSSMAYMSNQYHSKKEWRQLSRYEGGKQKEITEEQVKKENAKQLRKMMEFTNG